MQHKPHQKLGVISGAPEGYADPAPHVAPVVLLMLLDLVLLKNDGHWQVLDLEQPCKTCGNQDLW